MTAAIWRIPDETLLKDYPLRRSLDEWFFRVTETSSGVWLAEGSGVWGRKVSRQGTNPDALLEQCEKDARSMGALIVP